MIRESAQLHGIKMAKGRFERDLRASNLIKLTVTSAPQAEGGWRLEGGGGGWGGRRMN